MDFELTAVQRALREEAHSFARDQIAPAAAENDRNARFPSDLVRGLGERGLLAVNVPAEFGGREAGAVAYALAVMEIARADCAMAVTMAVTNMVAETIARFGTEECRRRYVPVLAGGEPGAFALSEPLAGSDAAALRTNAIRREGRFVLTGEKQWITSGDVAGAMVVWARSDPGTGPKGITAFVLDRSAPGLSVGRHEAKMGIRASSTVSLAFDGVEVPDWAVLGKVGEGFKVALTALDGGRIGIASQATGTIRAALQASVYFAKDLEARGIALSQGTAFMLADTAVEAEASQLLTLRAAARKESGLPFTREAAMAKLWASEAAQRAVSRAVRVHGLGGYTDAFFAERNLRDARVQTIYEGTSEVQRLVIARELLRNSGTPSPFEYS